MSLSTELRSRFDSIVNGHRVVLFMKGDRRQPMCGFSGGVVRILDEVVDDYETVNVLSDEALREGIKAYSEWPTIPQLYVDGKFVGGADIVKEMHGTGELSALLRSVAFEAPKAPSITVTEAAAKALAGAIEAESEPLHLEVTSDFRHDLFFGPRGKSDLEVRCGAGLPSEGIVLLVDARSAARAEGVRIDAVTTPQGLAFKIDNPNEPAKVRPITATGLSELMAKGTPFELVDVRTPGEQAIASLPKARPFDDEAREHIATLSKDAMIVFYCHHGIRSRNAAMSYATGGYRNVFNLEGGIDAWSTQVDPSVTRY